MATLSHPFPWNVFIIFSFIPVQESIEGASPTRLRGMLLQVLGGYPSLVLDILVPLPPARPAHGYHPPEDPNNLPEGCVCGHCRPMRYPEHQKCCRNRECTSLQAVSTSIPFDFCTCCYSKFLVNPFQKSCCNFSTSCLYCQHHSNGDVLYWNIWWLEFSVYISLKIKIEIWMNLLTILAILIQDQFHTWKSFLYRSLFHWRFWQDFNILVLDEVVLQLSRRLRRDMVGVEPGDETKANRHAAYRQYILWTFGRLHFGDRRLIPSCCVWRIRDKYPDPHGHYTDFKPGELF